MLSIETPEIVLPMAELRQRLDSDLTQASDEFKFIQRQYDNLRNALADDRHLTRFNDRLRQLVFRADARFQADNLDEHVYDELGWVKVAWRMNTPLEPNPLRIFQPSQTLTQRRMYDEMCARRMRVDFLPIAARTGVEYATQVALGEVVLFDPASFMTTV